MHITILQSGTLKDPHVAALRDEYVRRFSRYGRLTICEQRRPRWPDRGMRLLCDERGKTYSSRELAQQFEQWCMQSGSLCLAIGDAHGHQADFAAASHQRLALSALTLPHRLAHLLLVEQVYRAACILAGHPYHHD